MNSQQFVFWLQGLFELSEVETLDAKQVQTIKNHLKLVFLTDIDPGMSDDPVTQQIMQNIHDGKPAMEGIDLTGKPPVILPSSGSPLVKC